VRVTSGGGANANFYMLVPANTNSGITGVNPAVRCSFSLRTYWCLPPVSAAGISTNSIKVTVNASMFQFVVFSGSSVSWNVSYPNLKRTKPTPSSSIVTDANGKQRKAAR